MSEQRYTIISSDTHAGGSHEQYRSYLDSRYRADFDAWRLEYRNPFKDLKDDRRARNWDSDLRWRDQHRDGVVAEVVFPNTVPPFFPNFVLFAPPPQPGDYELRRAGIQAHNRWLVDFCAQSPGRRAGIGQIFVNNVDHAIEDAIWIREAGLKGGVLLPNVAPDITWVPKLYDPCYDPLWEVLEDLQIPVHVHGGTGVPNHGKHPFSMLLMIDEMPFYSQRPFVHLTLGGVFHRFPRLKVVITEVGCAWVPGLLASLDDRISRIRATGMLGETRYTDDMVPKMLASECFEQNCWMGVSLPGPADVAARHDIGVHKFMWGNDYPHDEGTHPFTREHLRQLFHDVPVHEMQAMLTNNAAELFGFDVAALEPYSAEHGPSVAELQVPLDELPESPNEVLRKGLVATPR
jgi:predicted TIM-barrel fold metal-dependent hydrolase